MKGKLSLICLAGLAIAVPAFAEDVGDPVFPVDLKDKSRFELIYGYEKRDMDFDGVIAEFESDTYVLRMHTDVGQYAYLDFDVGYMDPAEGSGAFYGGVGLRYLVYDAVRHNRSDAAMVRVISPVVPGEDGDIAAERLALSFVEAIFTQLDTFLPS